MKAEDEDEGAAWLPENGPTSFSFQQPRPKERRGRRSERATFSLVRIDERREGEVQGRVGWVKDSAENRQLCFHRNVGGPAKRWRGPRF